MIIRNAEVIVDLGLGAFQPKWSTGEHSPNE